MARGRTGPVHWEGSSTPSTSDGPLAKGTFFALWQGRQARQEAMEEKRGEANKQTGDIVGGGGKDKLVGGCEGRVGQVGF